MKNEKGKGILKIILGILIGIGVVIGGFYLILALTI